MKKYRTSGSKNRQGDKNGSRPHLFLANPNSMSDGDWAALATALRARAGLPPHPDDLPLLDPSHPARQE